MGIIFVVIAAILASTSNYCLRRSIDAGGSSKAYMVVMLSFSFLAMILLNPVRTGDYGWDTTTVMLGLSGGVLFGLFMWGLGRTLEKGPPGLTFAILNTSSVMPAIVMTFLFGALYGHLYTIYNAVGSGLVVIGLFWAGWTSAKNTDKMVWALFALMIFLAHTLFLAYLQWWAMVLQPDLPLSRLLPLHVTSSHVQWFMPAVSFTGALFQWVVYLKNRERVPKKAEVIYGIFGGLTNASCTFFLILAPQVAKPWQNAILFPIFSVGVLVICNVWAQLIYKEPVNWKANALCVAGLIVATLFVS